MIRREPSLDTFDNTIESAESDRSMQDESEVKAESASIVEVDSNMYFWTRLDISASVRRAKSSTELRSQNELSHRILRVMV